MTEKAIEAGAKASYEEHCRFTSSTPPKWDDLPEATRQDFKDGFARKPGLLAYLDALPPAPVDEVMKVVEKYAAKMKTAWGNVLELNIIPEQHRLAAQILQQESSEILTRLRSLSKEPSE